MVDLFIRSTATMPSLWPRGWPLRRVSSLGSAAGLQVWIWCGYTLNGCLMRTKLGDCLDHPTLVILHPDSGDIVFHHGSSSSHWNVFLPSYCSPVPPQWPLPSAWPRGSRTRASSSLLSSLALVNATCPGAGCWVDPCVTEWVDPCVTECQACTACLPQP